VDTVTVAAEDLDRADGEDKEGGNDVAGKQYIPRLHAPRIEALSYDVHQDSQRGSSYP
jgi:hypothetical protein